MAEQRGHRDKMRGECVTMFNIITKRRNLPVSELADEMGVSEKTARRWVHCFSAIMPVEVRKGTVIVEDDII
jgi:predicted DNA-binding transcriptional regulator YafY